METKNAWRKIKLSFADKWPLILTCLLSTGLIWFAYGCEPTTRSLTDPTIKVNREQLEIELESLLRAHTQRISDLDKQQQIRNVIFEQTLLIAQTGTVNPLSIVTGVLALLGIGATADDLRLRKQRKKQPIYESVEKTNTTT